MNCQPRRNRSRAGATTVEMTLVGIPIIFVMISVFEMSRGMWMYHTTSHAAKVGVRYAIVHGADCANTPPFFNTCSVSMKDIVNNAIRPAAVGLDLNQTQVTFCTVSCATGTTSTCHLSGTDCPTDAWPPTGANAPGNTLEIDIITPFQSALGMFWPGSKPVSFALVNFGAKSSDLIQY